MWRTIIQFGLLLGLIAVWPGPLRADTFLVQVRASAFSPNDLAIQPGDRVRWILVPPEGAGCQYYCPPGGDPMHTVTADDGSFSSGAPASEFEFEHLFEAPGEYFYHCEVHSAAGRDIHQFMNGRVVVGGGPGNGFQINAGLNDAWYDPATSGQGMFITVFPDIQSIFLAWFTYDTDRPPADVEAVLGEPGHRWLTAFGPYDGDTATLDIELTSGGVFDAAEPMPDAAPDGGITVVFSDCNSATVSYDMIAPALQGQVLIQRIAPDNAVLCESAAAR